MTIFPERIPAAVEEFAVTMMAQRIKDSRKTHPNREPDATIVASETNKHRIQARQFAEKISTDAGAFAKLEAGSFNQHNKFTRKLFTTITGVDLGKTNASAVAAVRQWIGEDVCQAIEARKAQEDREAAEKIEAEQKAADAKRLDAIVKEMRENAPISGEDLIFAARAYEVEISPRTVGMIRKRIHGIRSGNASVTGKGDIENAFRAYRMVERAAGIVRQPAEAEPASTLPEATDAEMAHLFSRP